MRGTYFVIRGRVQGVGFRFFAERQARECGVRGWVRNRSDGAVEVLAIAAPEALERFRRQLQLGPPAAHVEAVEAEPAPLSIEELRAYRAFSITATE